MPKKLTPEQVKFRETLETLKKQYEDGPANDQSRRIDAALSSLKGIRSSVASTLTLVDDLIKGLTAEDGSAGNEANQQVSDTGETQSKVRTSTGPAMNLGEDAPEGFVPFDARSETVGNQEELSPDEVTK